MFNHFESYFHELLSIELSGELSKDIFSYEGSRLAHR